MPDFKFWTKESAKRLAKAKDYPERAREAVAEMHRQVGDLTFDEAGLAVQGLLVRHLVMPGQADEAAAIFEFLAGLSPDTYVNVMGQYTPDYEVGTVVMKGAKKGETRYVSINRPTSSADTRAARAAAERAGLWRFDRRRLI